ncbi:hypothetical protein, partial [Vibrio parahaemolyticus]|uniref:hypothetical protein n=1 Tax=Vibrio parahaemolyticus TaxID=670 RepID=UPI001BAF98BF
LALLILFSTIETPINKGSASSGPFLYLKLRPHYAFSKKLIIYKDKTSTKHLSAPTKFSSPHL